MTYPEFSFFSFLDYDISAKKHCSIRYFNKNPEGEQWPGVMNHCRSL